MKKLKFILLFFLFETGVGHAQIVTESIVNNLSITGRSDGILFSTSIGKSAFQFPANSNKSMASLGAFWISARTQDSILLQSSIFNPLQPEFWSGPIDTLTRKSKNPDNWNSVYVASSNDIKLHRENFKNSGYMVPSNLANWPGNSLTGEALPAVLAPYIDWDLDGLYTPQSGDFPAIKGDNAIFQIYNDEFGEHNTSGGIPLKAQISQMVFNYTGYGMENVVFVEAYVKNMGDYDWKDCYIGFYTDVVLGNPNDNFIRTDVSKNMVFAYNGDEIDEGDLGYGNMKPYLSQVWLNRSLSSSTVFETDMPENTTQLRNVMEGYTIDGKLKYDSSGGSKFSFPGTTDLVNTKVERSEESLSSIPGKRKMLSVIGPLDIKMGKSIKLDIALLAGTTANNVETEVKSKTQLVTDFYNKSLSNGSNLIKSELIVFPNPCKSDGSLFIELPDNQAWTIEVIDITGALVFRSENLFNNTIIASNNMVACGVYYIRAISKDSIVFKKLIIN